MKENEPNPEAKAAEPNPKATPVEAKAAEPKPEATRTSRKPGLKPRPSLRSWGQETVRFDAATRPASHELYAQLGREEVRAVLAWEKAEGGILEDETKAEPKPGTEAQVPEVKAAEPKPDTNRPRPEPKAEAKAPEPKPESKAAEPAPEAKAAKPKREFRNKIIFTLSILGVLAALVAAYRFGMERKAQPPVFKPVSNPYDSAIYANGIIESDQSSGENINIFPEVSGPITQVLVREGQQVSAGTPLFSIDDSVQRATTEQLKSQSEAALAFWTNSKRNRGRRRWRLPSPRWGWPNPI
jgi:hypothetical protein